MATHLEGPVTQAALAVTTAAQVITATPFPSYRAFTVSPTNGTVYLGDSTVTSATGIPIPSGQSVTIATTRPDRYYLIAASGTVDVRLLTYNGVG